MALFTFYGACLMWVLGHEQHPRFSSGYGFITDIAYSSARSKLEWEYLVDPWFTTHQHRTCAVTHSLIRLIWKSEDSIPPFRYSVTISLLRLTHVRMEQAFETTGETKVDKPRLESKLSTFSLPWAHLNLLTVGATANRNNCSCLIRTKPY